ncbi:metal-dependent transcriptional regulator [Corynebacterium sp. HS2168-gen11]|uniref:metal-dependent transcriptional regulator n=1 Tax=Corynebacterium sp. HS2168-gen11 TaxID=2974027 RepID=UPI00216B26A0|nr:metal-dependent transcriptional regulator [Corynebacterium sp. HS2168-gen11]MCS4535356.1 metal-dependent transcriptional regulator [Corynebacterium sp. HS2168-gen11]
MHVDVSQLSSANQDYVKALYALTEWSDAPVTAKALSEAVGVRLSSASDAVRRLGALELVDYTPYGAITLTELGRAHAVQMIRRHRLLETFLVEALGYGWDQVHEEAEHLEHAVSDFMIDRIEKYLGFPEKDPHGDLIPSKEGTFPVSPSNVELIMLADLAADDPAVIERIDDADPELLQFFQAEGLVVGAEIEKAPAGQFTEAQNISIGGKDTPVVLGEAALRAVWVRPR